MKKLLVLCACLGLLFSTASPCLAGDAWLDSVILFDQPPGSNNTGVPENALGPKDGKYVSIDIPETAIFAFTDNLAMDGPGDDLRVYEEINGDSWVDIYASKDNVDYVYLGKAKGNIAYDLSTYGLDYVAFIKFVGLDNGGGSPGFDLDAVEALNSPYDFCECDLNHDGKCDMQDWLKFGDDWGRTDCEVNILGTWIGDEVDGQMDSWAFVFSEDRLDIVGPQEWYRGTFVRYKSVVPHQIDFIISQSSNPDNEGKISLGIYQIEDDTLSVAFYPPGDNTRPTSFTPDGTSRVFILNKY